jgi:S1-C subfamily serine protease
MNIMCKKLLLAIFTIGLLPGQAFAELPVSQIAQEFSPSVVTIVALDKNDQPLSVGSGFFIDTEGNIATNHHVLEGSARAIVKAVDGQKGEILEIIKDDPSLDLLVATTTLRNTTPLTFGDSDTVTVGEDIVAIGNPAGLEGTVSRGIVSGIRKAEDMQMIQITAPISPGSSGGPVFNLNGRVIGVATAYLARGQNLNFAMPVNYLKTLTPTRIKVYSLPKVQMKPGAGQIDKHLVQAFDIKLDYNSYSGEGSISFSIKNSGNYAVKNIRIFFLYKKRGKVIDYSSAVYAKGVSRFKSTLLPKLAKQFTHIHYIQNFYGGTVEIRILDYEIDRSVDTSPADHLFK